MAAREGRRSRRSRISRRKCAKSKKGASFAGSKRKSCPPVSCKNLHIGCGVKQYQALGKDESWWEGRLDPQSCREGEVGLG